MKRPLLSAWLILMLLCAAAGVQADSWAAPVVREVFSESREWFVRVVPGTQYGDTGGSATPKGFYAKAEFYRRQGDRSYRLVSEPTLVNPVAPVDFLVTNRGYLATIDNWGERGHGKIAVFYTPKGDLLQSFELKDLFSADEIDRFAHSFSSIMWRNSPHLIVRPGQQSLYVVLDDKGRELIFGTETGAWQLCELRADQHLCRTTNGNRRWTGYVEPKLRP